MLRTSDSGFKLLFLMLNIVCVFLSDFLIEEIVREKSSANVLKPFCKIDNLSYRGKLNKDISINSMIP